MMVTHKPQWNFRSDGDKPKVKPSDPELDRAIDLYVFNRRFFKDRPGPGQVKAALSVLARKAKTFVGAKKDNRRKARALLQVLNDLDDVSLRTLNLHDEINQLTHDLALIVSMHGNNIVKVPEILERARRQAETTRATAQEWINELPSGEAGEPPNIALRVLILDLAKIYGDHTGKRVTASCLPYQEDQQATDFVQFAFEVLSHVHPQKASSYRNINSFARGVSKILATWHRPTSKKIR